MIDVAPLIARIRNPDAPQELLAIRPDGRLVPMARGAEPGILHRAQPELLRLQRPWAAGGAVISREGPAVAVLGNQCLMAATDGEGVDWVTPTPDLATEIGLLWALQSATPSAIELHRCALLYAAVSDPDHVVEQVLAWCDGEYGGILRAHGLPTGAPTPRRVYATAHALGLPARHPIPGAAPESILAALATHIPPRWALAHEIRAMGRPDLAVLVMDESG